MCPGKAATSGTSCVVRLRAAAPQTPFEKGILKQPMLPWYGPTTSSSAGWGRARGGWRRRGRAWGRRGPGGG